MRIGIKIGSGILVEPRVSNPKEVIVSMGRIWDICRQIARLRLDGFEVFLVSSGAIASDPKKHRSDNLRASIGQRRLMDAYGYALEKLAGMEVSQILVTDHDLSSGVLVATLEEAFAEKRIIPVVNANDPTNDKESRNLRKCEDNDRLFGSVCQLANVDAALIAIDRAGLECPDGQIMHLIGQDNFVEALSYANGGSLHGHGENGMAVKIHEMKILAKAGIKSMLVPIKEENSLVRGVKQLLSQGNEELGTVFLNNFTAD